MNRKAREAALRIMLLTEEFSTEEIAEAISFIGAQQGEDLFTFLKRISSSPKRLAISRPGEAGFSTQGETRALQELKTVNGEKYQVLRDFELAIREGKILKTLDDFRAFARILGKDFTPGKSRREALGRLMSLLSQMDLNLIRTALANTPSRKDTGEDSFRRLANQIISGSRDPSTSGSE